MKRKNGFIATSLIYSFFLVFITLFLTIIADYLQNKVLLNTIENDIKQDLNNTITIRDFAIGDLITFAFSYTNATCYNSSLSSTTTCNIKIPDLTSPKTFEVKNKYAVAEDKEDTIYIVNVDDTTEEYYLKISHIRFTKPSGEVNNKGVTLGGVL